MTIAKRLTSLLALCTIGLAGCSYAGAQADREAAAQPTPAQPSLEQQPQEPGPQPTATVAEPTTPSATAASAPSDGGGSAPLQSDGGGDIAQPSDGGGDVLPAPTGIALVDASESTVTYLRAIQDFSPTIESWQITDNELHYVAYTCLGTVDHETYASLRPQSDGRTTVRWEGNPPGLGSSDEDALTIDENTLRYVDTIDEDGPANTHFQAEFGEFSRMCAGAGKDLAGFVL